MDAICRLCCSTKFVNNYIFDEENALFLKMSLYLPIKILKDDLLPQKICNKCSCKVNDFYQFCNEAIEAQSRLRAVLVASGILFNDTSNHALKVNAPPSAPPCIINFNDRGTQTEHEVCISNIKVPEKVKEEKIEPQSTTPPISVKIEHDFSDHESHEINTANSDDSDDLSLLTLKEIKKKEIDIDENIDEPVQESKRGRKRKGKLKDLEILINALPDTDITVIDTNGKNIQLESKECKENSERNNGEESETTEITETEKVKRRAKIKFKEEKKKKDVFQCCVCFEKFVKKRDILWHYKSHAIPAQSSEAPPPPPQPDKRPLRCPRCKRTVREGDWAAHWQRHWVRDRQPYRCGVCEKTFHDLYKLFHHGLKHGSVASEPDKRFMCDLCPEGFVYMRSMLGHRGRAHPEASAAPALRCPVCGHMFKHSTSLRRHLRSHTGERNFLCNVCGKALSSGEHLKFHIRIHTGDKPHECKTCGKGFVKKCNLTLHERVHSGEKPYVCSHCGKAFSQRSTLIIHERYHSGARPYECAVCGRAFVSRGLLTMHVKTRCYAPDT